MSPPISARAWLLKIAAEVEQAPARWTQKVFARTHLQAPTDPQSLIASCWCASGFSIRDNGSAEAHQALLQAANAPSIARHNDSLTNAAEFVAWFRAAAELCK